MYAAIKNNNKDLFMYIMDTNIQVHDDMIYLAAQEGNIHILRYFYSKGYKLSPRRVEHVLHGINNVHIYRRLLHIENHRLLRLREFFREMS